MGQPEAVMGPDLVQAQYRALTMEVSVGLYASRSTTAIPGRTSHMDLLKLSLVFKQREDRWALAYRRKIFSAPLLGLGAGSSFACLRLSNS